MKRQTPSPGPARSVLSRLAVACPLTLVVWCTWLGSVASAQESLQERRRDAEKGSSAQDAALELRFGRYEPKVDDNTSQPVFNDFFGDKPRYSFGFELDWQIWRAPYVGTLGVGAGWGYTQISGPNQPEQAQPADSPPISQKSNLNIMPMYAVGVLRIDSLARNVGVPLVPYAKFGLAYALWWVNDGIGIAETDVAPTIKGKDTSIGTQAAIGAMFLLDVLEPSAARAMDNASGVNNSYLFIEWSMSNFGGQQMNVGSDSWVAGLAFEM